jgi:release factor glutamine methyltransferase
LTVAVAAAGGGLERAASVRSLVHAATDRLAAAGCDSPRLDADLLLADALGADRARLYAEPERPIGEAATERFHAHVVRRERREPIAYILGRRAFRRLELAVDPRVLIPRPETELLVEVVLAELAPGAHVHDVGTGSGAVALALKHEQPDLRVSASDASGAALAVARANAERLGLAVELLHGPNLPDGLAQPDLVVANLPYVRPDEWAGLTPEIVCYEPRDALLGGDEDGLGAIRELVTHAPSGTRLALEHAPAQAAAVRALLSDGRSVAAPGGVELVTIGRAR